MCNIFCNIILIWGRILQLMKVTNHTRQSCQICLISLSCVVSVCYSPDLPPCLRIWPLNRRFWAYVTLPDYRRSCNSCPISTTIYLLFCDQLHLQLSYNQYFWLFRVHYDSFRTCKAKIPIRCTLSNYAQNEPIKNETGHKLTDFTVLHVVLVRFVRWEVSSRPAAVLYKECFQCLFKEARNTNPLFL